MLADAIDYLVTEDGGIHKKARRLALSERVLTLQAAIELLSDLQGNTPTPPPFVEQVKSYSLDDNDPIFASFRSDYPEFDKWLRKVKLDHRDCWVVKIAKSGRYAGVAIVKAEVGGEVQCEGSLLKVCSFKIASDANGIKLGELLLKALFEYARARAFDNMYVTVFERHAPLVALLRQFGFRVEKGGTAAGELVMLKVLKPGAASGNPLEDHIWYGPGYVASYTDTPGHVIPIQPKFHDALFPDAAQQLQLIELDTPRPCGCAIRKAYLYNSPMRRLAAGDNLFFYRSGDMQSIRCTGVVEKVLVSKDAEEIARFVGVRTVYTYSQIHDMTRDRDVLAIMFRHDRNLPAAIARGDLCANGVFRRAPQSITEVHGPGRQWLASRILGDK